MLILKKSPTLWAVYDPGTRTIPIEDATLDEVVDFLLDLRRDDLKAALEREHSRIPWEEVEFMAGRYICCECGKILDIFNHRWPIERQRCKSCLENS